MTSRLIVVFMIVICSFSTNAEITNVCKNEKVTSVLFINGMRNKDIDVATSEVILRDLIYDLISVKGHDFLPVGQKVEVSNLRNNNEPIMTQFAQVLSQRSFLEIKNFNLWFNEKSKKPDWLKGDDKKHIDKVLSERVSKEPNYNDSDLLIMKQEVLSLLERGNRVILVSHSQGNMYALMIYRDIALKHPEFQNSIGILSVATPASPAETYTDVYNGYYITAYKDMIINAVRYFYPSTLSANKNLGNLSEDWLNHSFVKTYMSSIPSISFIKSSLESMFNNLSFPGSEINEDINLKVTLIKDQYDKHFGVEEYNLETSESSFVETHERGLSSIGNPYGKISTDSDGNYFYTVNCNSLPLSSMYINVKSLNLRGEESTFKYLPSINNNVIEQVDLNTDISLSESDYKNALTLRVVYDEETDTHTFIERVFNKNNYETPQYEFPDTEGAFITIDIEFPDDDYKAQIVEAYRSNNIEVEGEYCIGEDLNHVNIDCVSKSGLGILKKSGNKYTYRLKDNSLINQSGGGGVSLIIKTGIVNPLNHIVKGSIQSPDGNISFSFSVNGFGDNNVYDALSVEFTNRNTSTTQYNNRIFLD